jgi:oligopeptide transport system ATP-binding protein
MNNTEKTPLLQVKNLKKHFDLSTIGNKRVLAAVDGIDFVIYKGETFGLVGESGCGKTTTGRLIVKLYNPTEGQIIFDGIDYAGKSDRELKPFRKRVQMIFQDPYASLNARMTVNEIIAEGIKTHKILTDKVQIEERVQELLEKVGLKREHSSRYPHEFSGGQRQRIGIARALALNPELIVADEPISALDVSIQAQVINMLEDLQKEFELTFLFIAHDLSMVRHISDRIGVMYLGKMMEIAESDTLYENPLHPYTKSLLSAIPVSNPRVRMSDRRVILKGDVTSPINPTPGCRFATRCPYAKDNCHTETPEIVEVQKDHFVACHYVDEINGLNTFKK